MRLKERLDSIKLPFDNKGNIQSELSEKINIKDIFADNEEIRKLITDSIKAEKNIIFVVNKSIDKKLIVEYFNFLLTSTIESNVVINNTFRNIIYSQSTVNILAEPEIKEIVKIFEYIMYGYKSFVFGLNMSTNDNLLSKLKVAIAINYKNLMPENIDVLIGSSNSMFVSFSKTEEGLLYISNVSEIKYENFNLISETVLDVDASSLKLNNDIEYKQELIQESVNIEQQTLTEDEVVNISSNDETVSRGKKANKYKQLKEKIRCKRNVLN